MSPNLENVARIANDEHRKALSIRGFCDTFGVGLTFTYAEIKGGRLRAVKCGRRTLILAADAERWAAALPSLNRKAAS